MVTSLQSPNVAVGGYNMGPLLLGYVDPLDRNSNEVDMDDNWHSIAIYMNTNQNVWNSGGVSLAVMQKRAAKTFIHEVGHVLKLAHPGCAVRCVMHSGYPNAGMVSPSVTAHDLMSIARRWP